MAPAGRGCGRQAPEVQIPLPKSAAVGTRRILLHTVLASGTHRVLGGGRGAAVSNMPGERRMRTLRSIVLLSLAASAVTLLATQRAEAEEPGISATGKGITGGALLGGELVVTVEAIAGVKPAWAYLVGGGLGAVAGGVGGYFVEQTSDPKPSYYMLAAGMALIIPATVAVLQSTSYKPPPDYQEDRPGKAAGPSGEPAPAGVTTTPPVQEAQPPAGSVPPAPAAPGATPAPGPGTAPAPVPAPGPGTRAPGPSRPPIAMSLVDLYGGRLRMGIPAVEIRPMYTSAEIKKYGVEQQAEVRLPLFQATF